MKVIAETRVIEGHKVTHQLLDFKVPAETRATEYSRIQCRIHLHKCQVGLDRQDLEGIRVKRAPRVIQDSREIRVTKVFWEKVIQLILVRRAAKETVEIRVTEEIRDT